MKKVIATVCLIGSTIALSACESGISGKVETAPPYSLERTASHGQGGDDTYSTPSKVKGAEQVFQRAQHK
ncbi:MAG: hypothetical protein GC137_01140 [Alphaproteobacteria bacterium]|nr:hypothetical protein [Alphaproteobacteria bacterium]